MTTDLDEAAPLQWPECWKRQSNVDRFLVGMPFVGPDRRALRELRRQLAGRNWRVLGAWRGDPPVVSIAAKLRAIIRKELEWPNDHFIPSDPCEILLFDPTMELRSVIALVAIEQAFCLPRGFLESVDRQTLGELVTRIAEWQREREQR